MSWPLWNPRILRLQTRFGVYAKGIFVHVLVRKARVKSGNILSPFFLNIDVGHRSVVSLNASAALNSIERVLVVEQE